MGKKSAASLSVVPAKPATVLAPPSSFSARQKELWKEIVLARPASWFDGSNSSLLVGYVKAIASHETLAVRSDAIEATLTDTDLKLLNRVHGMIERQAKLIQTFATKLRLTQQSRYTPAAAATAASKVSSTRPWDEGK